LTKLNVGIDFVDTGQEELGVQAANIDRTAADIEALDISGTAGTAVNLLLWGLLVPLWVLVIAWGVFTAFRGYQEQQRLEEEEAYARE
jgi:hypothetical protein